MTAEDAALAVEHGVQGIYISNHGGRQLDHVLGNIQMLPEIVAATEGKAEIFIDGGFTRGTDVIKALASQFSKGGTENLENPHVFHMILQI